MKKEKKIVSIILIIILLLSGCVKLFSAEYTVNSNAKITLETDCIELVAGTKIAVYMDIDMAGENADTLSATINFDTSVLSFDATSEFVTSTDTKFNAPDYSVNNGTIGIETGRSSANAGKSGRMFTFYFNVLKTTTSSSVSLEGPINFAYVGSDYYIDGYTLTLPKVVQRFDMKYDQNTTDTVTNMPADGVKIETRAYKVGAAPSRAEYVFTGWNTKADGTGTKYAAGASYTTEAAATFYAQWTEATYTIGYNLNGGSATGNPTSYKKSTATFTLNNPTKAGHTFDGWTGTGLSAATQTVTVNTGSTGNRSYTANWTINKYTVTFYDEDRTTVLGTSTVDYNTAATAPANPTKPNTPEHSYVFAGWDKAFKNVTEDMSVYAKYTESTNKFTVTFYNEDKTTVLGTSTVNYGANATYTGSTPVAVEEKGYTKTFTGWDNESALQNVTEDRKVYAQYDKQKIEYKISYEDTYGAENTNITSYTVEDENIALSDLVRDGYEFKGWFTTRNYTTQITQIDTSEAKDVTLYAWWNQKQVEVPVQQGNLYYVKVLFRDETTEENTFEYFNDARLYADMHSDENVRVFDSKGHILYEPTEKIQDLYLKTNTYSIGDTDTNKYQEDDVYISNISPETTLKALKTRCVTNGQITVYKANGDELAEDECLGTNMILRITRTNQTIILTVVVTGDLDGNGKVTVTDLSLMNKNIVGDVELVNAYGKAADVDFNGKISVTDLSRLSKAIVENILGELEK